MAQVGRPRTKSPILELVERSKWVPHNWPAEIVEVARRRVEGLLHHNIITAKPIHKLLESAYLQGIEDTLFSLDSIGKLKTDEEGATPDA